MIRRFWVGKIEPVSNAFILVGTFVVALMAGAEKVDVETLDKAGAFYSALKSIQGFWLPIFVPLSAALIGGVGWIKYAFGSRNTWNTVTHLLEEYRMKVLETAPDVGSDPEFHHRITLYKYVRWRLWFCKWPWTGWVVPVARTGRVTLSHRIPRFRTFDNDPDRAEGVAAQAYVSKLVVPVDNLPLLDSNSDDKSIETYASHSFVEIEWVKKRIASGKDCRILSMVGIPIEVNGTVWGVLVIDSRRNKVLVTQADLMGPQFRGLAAVLGKLLES